jgi:hypothetical protein
VESFRTELNGRKLAAAMTPTSASLTLVDVPADLAAGRFALKIDLEVMVAVYPGNGRTFSLASVDRGLDGTTPRAHLADSRVLCPIRGASLEAIAIATREAEALRYVRPPAVRAFIASNFN